MKTLFVASLLIVSGASIGQTASYRLSSQGKDNGAMQSTDVYTATQHTDHSVFKIQNNGQDVLMVIDDAETSQGDWTSKTLKVSAAGQNVTVIATPTPTGAHVVIDAAGQKQTKDVPKISNVSTRNPTIGWFRLQVPKVGATITYQRFDIQSLTWAAVTLKYVGPTSVLIGGKSRQGFAVQKTEAGKSESGVVDKEDQLIKYQAGDLMIERVYK